jgi:DNA uptake protein ComE-like DNA-binding protein
MRRSDRKITLAALAVALLALVMFRLLDTSDKVVPSAGKLSPAIGNRAHNDGRGAASAYYSGGETAGQGKTEYYSSGGTARYAKTERFPFDPNTADSMQLLRLGLRPWQVRNIYKFRARGGIYRRKQDFARLYGLTVKEYRELEPYIRISKDYLPAATLVQKEVTADRDTMLYPVKIKDGQQVVLNTADTLQLRKVPGIGSYFAKEILRHGQWLGGYVSVDQLDEIEGFPAEAKKYFTVKNARPRLLNINKLTIQQLRRHPYINYYQAKTIADYRRLHGTIHSLDDLRFSKDFPEPVIRRLAPYITF